MTEAPLTRSKKIKFALIACVLVALSIFVVIHIGGFIFDLILWEKLVSDIDHRLEPNPEDGISPDGIRTEHLPDYFKEDQFNIIVAGDSYTQGFRLPAESAPPQQLELLIQAHFKSKNYNVINFGWTGSSPFLSLRLLQDKGKKYKPDVVIYLLDLTDFKADFFYKSVAYRKGYYGFLIDHPYIGYFIRTIAMKTDRYTNWNTKLMGYPDFSTYFVAHQPYEKSVPYFDNTFETLQEMNLFVTEELGARFFVFAYPRHWQYTDKESPESWERHNYQVMGPYTMNNFRYIKEKEAVLPFPVISLFDDFRNSEVFPTTFDTDSHWNSNGARLAAQLVFQHCLALSCFENEARKSKETSSK